MRKIIHTDMAPAAIGPYSQAIDTGNTVYLSGMLGVDPATGVLAEGIVEQTKQIVKNIDNLLKAAGYSKDDVVKTTCFIADMGDFATFNEVYGAYFTSKPARSCVAVKTLPKNALAEVEVIAVK
ncbi:MAG: RidA family protein [Erysipelotrichaceae bacterium]